MFEHDELSGSDWIAEVRVGEDGEIEVAEAVEICEIQFGADGRPSATRELRPGAADEDEAGPWEPLGAEKP